MPHASWFGQWGCRYVRASYGSVKLGSVQVKTKPSLSLLMNGWILQLWGFMFPGRHYRSGRGQEAVLWLKGGWGPAAGKRLMLVDNWSRWSRPPSHTSILYLILLLSDVASSDVGLQPGSHPQQIPSSLVGCTGEYQVVYGVVDSKSQPFLRPIWLHTGANITMTTYLFSDQKKIVPSNCKHMAGFTHVTLQSQFG